MEDHRKSRTQSTNHSDKTIVELTQEMELSDQKGGDIIDLTKNVDSPDATPVEKVPTSPVMESEMTPGEPARVAPPDEDPPHMIEEEVDAAFEAVQADPSRELEEEVPDEQLFDKLTGITELVDNAVRENEGSQTIETEATEIPGPESETTDDDSLAADAAVFEAAMEEESTQEESLESTDIADSAETKVAADQLDDDEIIELTEIVDPAELAQMHAAEPEDEEILELTDIVDPDEMAIEDDDEDEEILELTDIVAPAGSEIAIEENPSEAVDEMEITEPPIDDPIMSIPDDATALLESEHQELAAAETAEIADLFMEGMTLDEPSTEEIHRPTLEQAVDSPLSEMADPTEEQVIQLSDVLGQTVREDRPPIEKIKMGAEEDLAAQPISIEREDTANALGLNLENRAPKEEIPLHDPEIETTIEHLLKTKYAETINRIVADAVEKAVAREMEAIKRSMQDGDDARA